MPISRSIEDIVDWYPRINEDWLLDYWQLRTASAAGR
jgi:hypothetical protein